MGAGLGGGAEGTEIPAPHASQHEDAFPCPTDGSCSWNNVKKYNTKYGTGYISLGKQEVKRSNVR